MITCDMCKASFEDSKNIHSSMHMSKFFLFCSNNCKQVFRSYHDKPKTLNALFIKKSKPVKIDGLDVFFARYGVDL
jgi:YHS domain-containing protein